MYSEEGWKISALNFRFSKDFLFGENPAEYRQIGGSEPGV